jgi:hypothetical protein
MFKTREIRRREAYERPPVGGVVLTKITLEYEHKYFARRMRPNIRAVLWRPSSRLHSSGT